MSLLRKSFLTTVSSVFCAIFGVVTQMILSRKLMPEGMGQYQIFLNAGIIAAAFVCLGIGQANIYFLNRLKSDKTAVTMNAIYIWLFGGTILTFFMFLIIKLFDTYFGYLPDFSILCFSIGVAGIMIVNLLRPILVADLRMKQVVAVSTILPVTYMILVSSLAIIGNLRIETSIIAISISHLVSSVLLLYFIRHNINFHIGFDLSLFSSMLKHGLKLFMSNLVLIASTSVALLLLRYLMMEDFSQIGFFGRAVAICGLIRLISSSVTPMLYAKWSKVSSEQRGPQVERALRMQVTVNVTILICILVFGKWIIAVLYGRSFMPAVIPMYILVIGEVFRSMVAIYTNLLAGDGKPMLNTLIFGVSIPVVVIFMFFLTPLFGIVGAAAAQTLSYFVSLILAIIIVKRHYEFKLRMAFILNKSDIQYIRNSFSRKTSLKN